MSKFYIKHEGGTRFLIAFWAIIAIISLKSLIFGEGYWWIHLPVFVAMEWAIIRETGILGRKYAVRDSVLSLERFAADQRLRDTEIGKRLREITLLARQIHELGDIK